MKPEFLNKAKKKKILEKLSERFGISSLPFLLLEVRSRIFAYSGCLSLQEIAILAREVRIEQFGVFLLEKENDSFILGFDACSLLKEQITKNIIEISEEQAEKWLRGEDLEIKTGKGYFAIKNNDNLLGCGKSSGEKITNLMPRERRVKN